VHKSATRIAEKLVTKVSEMKKKGGKKAGWRCRHPNRGKSQKAWDKKEGVFGWR